ncbi:M949_RS01915 family surface polysaccharide biosynthesis protein [Duganella sp. 1411]|uniref:M949_RS01915 family surface polysaccharide biosynthesis protein n=1 Tax=Duganella sp. 1411 TaxID=2806572 RepID=UPI0035A57EF8
MDADASFFPAALTFTDLNHDGRMKVTVSYRTFCSGGVDPYTVKVILRDGATKLAIRGESLVRFPGQPPFGGTHQHDKALLSPAYAAYKQHLDQIWKVVSADNRK